MAIARSGWDLILSFEFKLRIYSLTIVRKIGCEGFHVSLVANPSKWVQRLLIPRLISAVIPEPVEILVFDRN